jgi:hypothetical protein
MKNLYQLILLSGLSSCLVTTAQANESAGDGVYLKTPDFYRDVACGAAPRFIDLWLKNHTDDELDVVSMDLIPQLDDSGLDVLSIAPATWEDSCGYGLPDGSSFKVAPHHSCKIVIEVDPSVTDVTEDCYTTPTLIPSAMDATTNVLTGVVDQILDISFRNYPGELSTEIYFDMTYLGSTNSFALVGDHICNDDDDACAVVPKNLLDGTIQVSQDVAVTGEGCHEPDANCLTDDIELNGNRAYIDDHVSEAAESDLGNGFWNLFNLSRSPFQVCDFVVDTSVATCVADAFCNDLGNKVFSSDDASDGTLVVCFNGGSANTGLATFADNNGGTQFIIILDFPVGEDPTNPIYDYALSIESGADFDLIGNPGANPDNIYWVVNGNIEAHIESAFVGNVATVGYVEVEPGEMGSQALFLGRLLAYDNDLELQGNTIDCPNCLLK